MPTRRRPSHISAAALPVRRLPLGTPRSAKFPDTNSLLANAGRHSPSQLQSQTSNSNLKIDSTTDAKQESITPADTGNMAPKDSSDSRLAKCIADAKLERQKKRIEEADNPPPRKQTARGKGKQWKPFDYTVENLKVAENDDLPINEVRVNTFRGLSRERLSGAGSSVRSNSVDTRPSERERPDSALTDHGFQVFIGRENRQNYSELNACEDKSEERQTTVEAVFDEQEIYRVFGNALPGSDFIKETVGTKDGIVQFIQHPNGDISSYQWCEGRYMWENIGQFSNIRKKIEGQLASERLKGETAYQNLQRNTLSYFRTIAKQREANKLGLPFGPKEIQAAMPLARNQDLPAAPSRLNHAMKDTPTVVKSPQVDLQNIDTSSRGDIHASSKPKPPHQPLLRQNVYHGPVYQFSGHDDPFSSPYPAQPYYATRQYTYSQVPGPTGYAFDSSQRRHVQGLNYDFHFPPAGTNQNGGHSTQTHAQFHTHVYGHPPYTNQYGSYGIPTLEIAAPQPRSVMPFGNRSSISDQLWKISETAKERNESQGSIGRTVLYDPYQNHSALQNIEPRKDSSKEMKTQSGPNSSDNLTEKNFRPHAEFDPTSANFFPTVLATQTRQQMLSAGAIVVGEHLHKGKPDVNPDAESRHHGSLSVSPIVSHQPARQDTKCSFLTASDHSHHSNANIKFPSANREVYDRELEEWWTSGNKFARQQEFFESIMATSKTPNSTNATKVKSSPLMAIGSNSRAPKDAETPPINQASTRLLIPVLENLASYVQGPIEKRRDYFSQWSQPPEWCIDRSEGGNNSFFDREWGQPPARVGRDVRYQHRSWGSEPASKMNKFSSPSTRSGDAGGFGMGIAVGSGIDRRFKFAGRY